MCLELHAVTLSSNGRSMFRKYMGLTQLGNTRMQSMITSKEKQKYRYMKIGL